MKSAEAAKPNPKYICFEWNNGVYGVPACDLIGAAGQCPRVSYPGLPPSIAEIAYWKGRLYAVRSWGAPGGAGGPSGTYLFTRVRSPFGSMELALRVPGRVFVRADDGSFSLLSAAEGFAAENAGGSRAA